MFFKEVDSHRTGDTTSQMWKGVIFNQDIGHGAYYMSNFQTTWSWGGQAVAEHGEGWDHYTLQHTDDSYNWYQVTDRKIKPNASPLQAWAYALPREFIHSLVVSFHDDQTNQLLWSYTYNPRKEYGARFDTKYLYAPLEVEILTCVLE
jgi:hypothetical protein